MSESKLNEEIGNEFGRWLMRLSGIVTTVVDERGVLNPLAVLNPEIADLKRLAKLAIDLGAREGDRQALKDLVGHFEELESLLNRDDASKDVEFSEETKHRARRVMRDANVRLRELIFPALLAQQEDPVSSLQAARRNVSAELTDLLEKAQLTAAELERSRNVTKKIAELDQQRIQARGVASQLSRFDFEARGHRVASGLWLVATLGGAAWLLLLGYRSYQRGLYPDFLPDLTASQLTQYLVSRALLYSVLISATVWCSTIYKSHRHNVVVNRHRSNALGTFQEFAASASDEQTKAAVLLQACNAIFAPQHTGYSSTDSDPKAPSMSDGISSAAKKAAS